MSNNIMSPEFGKLQQQTDWRALSGDIPFNKRFDPSGPYAAAFEAGGWDPLKQQLIEEKKQKREQALQNSQANDILGNMLRGVMSKYPDYQKMFEKKGISGISLTATKPAKPRNEFEW